MLVIGHVVGDLYLGILLALFRPRLRRLLLRPCVVQDLFSCHLLRVRLRRRCCRVLPFLVRYLLVLLACGCFLLGFSWACLSVPCLRLLHCCVGYVIGLLLLYVSCPMGAACRVGVVHVCVGCVCRCSFPGILCLLRSDVCIASRRSCSPSCGCFLAGNICTSLLQS